MQPKMTCAAVFISLIVTITTAQAEAHAIKWMRRLDEAQRVAVEEKKDLLINFTGHGWCYYCTLLDRDVFSQVDFIPAAKDFVLVELDFPSVEDLPAGDLKNAYQGWKKQYLIHGWPTVVLADSAGKPYAYTGYDDDLTPQKFLAELSSHQAARKIRDQELAEATSATGIPRAKKLHAAIQAVAPLLGTLDERQEDPVLTFYGDLVDEIRQLDADNSSGLRELYGTRIAARNEWIARETVFFKLKEFNATQDNRGAIAYLDEALKKTDDPKIRWRLEWSRQVHLEWDEQYEEALKNVRRLLELPGLSEEDRESLLDREAFNLFNTERLDEGIAHYDREIAAAHNNPEKHLRLLRWKAQMLLNRQRPEESIVAWRTYREATKPGTDDWMNATGLLALELRQAGQHRAALKLLGECLATDGGAEMSWTMLDAAESHIALGENEKARELIDQSEAASNALKESVRHSDKEAKEAAEHVEKRIKDLRAQLETKKSQ